MRKFIYGVDTFHGIYYGQPKIIHDGSTDPNGKCSTGFTYDVRMSTPDDRRIPVAAALERVRDGHGNAPDKALLQEIIDALRG